MVDGGRQIVIITIVVMGTIIQNLHAESVIPKIVGINTTDNYAECDVYQAQHL
jgi:hypothetical protein